MKAPISRTSARLWTLVAQGAGGATLLAGAALFVLAPGQRSSSEGRADPVATLNELAAKRTAELAASASGETVRAPDYGFIAYNLSLLPNAPPPEVEPEDPTPDPDPLVDATPPPTDAGGDQLIKRFEYLGAIELRSARGTGVAADTDQGEIRRVAMIKVREDEQQRLVRVGGALDAGITLVAVDADGIELEQDGRRTRIPLTERSTASVTRTGGGTPAGVLASPATNPFATARTGGDSPEDLRQRALDRIRQRQVTAGSPQSRLGVTVADPGAVPQGDDQIRAYRERQEAIRRGEARPDNDG